MIEKPQHDQCKDCRYYFERAWDVSDPMGVLCSGYDADAVLGYCGYNVREIQVFATRPACRRFAELGG